MPAYAIVRYLSINDPAKLRDYAKLAYPSLKAFGAIPRVANTPGISVEGAAPLNVVMLEFRDIETAQAWYHSDDYQRACAMRQEAADAEVVLVEGVSG